MEVLDHNEHRNKISLRQFRMAGLRAGGYTLIVLLIDGLLCLIIKRLMLEFNFSIIFTLLLTLLVPIIFGRRIALKRFQSVSFVEAYNIGLTAYAVPMLLFAIWFGLSYFTSKMSEYDSTPVANEILIFVLVLAVSFVLAIFLALILALGGAVFMRKSADA